MSATQEIPAGPASHRRFLSELAAELALRDPAGQLLGRARDRSELVRGAADAAVDAARTWTEHLGPFHDTDGVRRLLGRPGAPVSRQAVSKRALLALRTGSGRLVYPAAQFRGGAPLPGLDALLAAVPETLVSRWTLASWLVSPNPGLSGDTPADALGSGEAAAVLNAARDWADALAA